MNWPPEALTFIQSARLAHLATSDAKGVPHVIPICFAFDGDCFFSVIDQKPKRAAPAALKRVRNITQNPNIPLVIDRYDEDWSRLAFILVTGTARIIGSDAAIALLREKYQQYENMDLDGRPVIEITPARVVVWGRLTPA